MADTARVGVVVPNLFLRWPVETAIRATGAQPVVVATLAEAANAGCSVLVVDLDAVGAEAARVLGALAGAEITVLAFGAQVERERLAAARAAGAVALPRAAFLARLPELLAAAIRPSASATD